ncbi:hypothetical protein [Chryseobacterium cucumeris]|uniref:hypothetical protein n=1 Tax=Chryseobacterium cucumeris TaxID=1813611 RepID=UPI003D990D72
MIPIGNSKVKDYLSASSNIKRFKSLSMKILHRLKLISKEDLIQEEIDFLESIIEYFADKNFFTINPKEAIETLKITPSKKVKDLIYNEFNYEARRRDTFPNFFNFLGIKTCVYCHAQFALSFENSEGKFVGLLQADHYNSKDKYPYLSVAFYNLYPVCGNCNLNKSNIDVEFELYSNKAPAINLQFKIEDKSFIKNFLEFDKSKLKIEIQYNEDYINKFYLNEIYKTQTDIVEELVYKSKVYNTTYRENLKKFDIDDPTIDRFIVGNYTLKDDVYKRPLSKMMTDIATDLDLIK